MQKQDVIAKLQAWATEYSGISDQQINVPSRFWEFLAQRIIDSGMPGFDDPDTVRAMIGGKLRLIRVQGRIRETGMIRYEFAEGVGFGFARVNEIIVEDHPKLADILDRLEGTTPNL